MEKPNKQPQRHDDLHDPKLPVVHGKSIGNRAEMRTCPAPISQTQCD